MSNAINGIETEYNNLNANQGWSVHYQKIRQASSDNEFTTRESVKPQNKLLNRYRDVSPYDHSRIVLKQGTTDYINANIVRIEKAGRTYILTQGPLANTVAHFWLMVWEQNSAAVLMLNKLIEKKQEKCYQYWPAKIGKDHIMTMDEVGLTLEYTEYHDYSYYLTRTLKLTETASGKFRDIIQFHYTTWPDFGVPSSPTAFLEFLRKVRQAGVLEQNVGPAVVHCSAGIGRSGTFCLVDSCLVLIEQGNSHVDVKEILLEMRQYRMGLIQTADQLRFSYQAIIEGAKKRANNENCNDDNATIPNDGTTDEEVVAEAHSSDEDEPPPLPPPRHDSLRNIPAADRPLPTIPNSVSLSDFTYDNSDSEREFLNGPLPTVPGESDVEEAESSVDEVDDEDEDLSCVEELPDGDNPLNTEKTDRCTSPESEARHRNRIKRQEMLSTRVRDMKRRQQANEQWTQFKRPRAMYPGHKLHKNELNLFVASGTTEASKQKSSVTTRPSESTSRNDANSNADMKALLDNVLQRITNIEKRYNTNNDEQSSYGMVKVKKKNSEGCKRPKWAHWTDWSSCSVSCGKGRQIRWRHCVENCSEAEMEMEEKTCQMPACSPAKLFGIIKI